MSTAPRKCPRCNLVNAPSEKACRRCATPFQTEGPAFAAPDEAAVRALLADWSASARARWIAKAR